ncbi:MAG: hypothetical protein GXO79_05125 [Chlorobi bacterium]|nr:hypothetical protein [Chlorobiota bacterium]
MELKTKNFDIVLSDFLTLWTVDRVEKMTIQEYANLSDHNSFRYWLEYGTKSLGAIGGIALHKFELWKPKNKKDFKDNRFKTDGEYVWNAKKGETSQEAFTEIKKLILEIILHSQKQNWKAIDTIAFHAIGKWKISFLYSNKKLLPIYSKRALLSISKGLGQEFQYKTQISVLQDFILEYKDKSEDIDDFAHRVYTQFAEKIKKRNYYIIGSKYGDSNGNDVIPKIDEFLKYNCVAIGFLDWLDFSTYMGSDNDNINKFVNDNWKRDKPAWYKIQRYFRLLSKIKEGDIIAVKSHGAHNRLTIIAYAEVVKRNGSIYEHNENKLGHHINVDFLDAGFYKQLGLTYAETIHQLTPKKDGDKFNKVFGWYADTLIKDREVIIGMEEGDDLEDSNYNEKSETTFERSATASVKVNLVHNRIQNRFLKYLMTTYPNDINIGERNRIDAKRETNSNIFIYEIKPFESVYACIRAGIGQLLDYSHLLKSKKNKKIIIVGPNEPEQRDIDFIIAIKNVLQIPFSYIAFDEEKLKLKEF